MVGSPCIRENLLIETTLFLQFGAALAIGLLVGLEREYSFLDPDHEHAEHFAGIRTFSLMGLAGCLAAMAADILSSPATFIGIVVLVGAFIAVAYFVDAWRGEVGLTTEIAALVVVLAGALCYWNQLALAVAVGVGTTVLLSLKLETQTLIRQITREDIYATLRFGVITAIILPVLPNENFGIPPLDVLNPYKIWLMVVLISGISFLGYLLLKIVSARQGIGLTGLLGGLASSTAVTLSFSQRSHDQNDLAKPFALAITVAWTVMFARVIIAVAALNVRLVRFLWLPMVTAGVVGLAYSAYFYLTQRYDEKDETKFSNPFEIGPAIRFGLLYAIILLIARAAQVYLGDIGIYASSIVAGLADADAIALSMAELSRPGGGLELTTAAQAVVLASMSNTVSKGGIVLATGSPALRRALLPILVLMPVVGILVAFLV
jgi:uncharacterized membrane protein (DUF4010 family)